MNKVILAAVILLMAATAMNAKTWYDEDGNVVDMETLIESGIATRPAPATEKEIPPKAKTNNGESHAKGIKIKIHSIFLSSEYSMDVVYEVDRGAFVECFGKDKDGTIIATGNDIAKSAKKGTVTFAIGSKTSLIKSAECQAEAKDWVF